MKIIIQFTKPVSKSRLLSCLKDAKNRIPAFREYLFEIKKGKYLFKDKEGEIVTRFNFVLDEENHLAFFDDLEGELRDQVERMLIFDFPERVGEECFACNKEENWKLYFSMSEWFLIERGYFFKIE